MVQRFKNNWSGLLADALMPGDVTMRLTDATGLPALVAGDYFKLTLVRQDGDIETAWEIVRVTGVSGNTLTVLRGQEGTQSESWAADTLVSLRLTAEVLGDLAEAEGRAAASASAALVSEQHAKTSEDAASGALQAFLTERAALEARMLNLEALGSYLGKVPLYTDLPATVTHATSVFGKTPTLSDFVFVELDPRYPDRVLMYGITGLASGVITWSAEPILKIPLTGGGDGAALAALEERVSNLELLGSLLGSVNTFSDLPATVVQAVTVFGKTPTANDFAFVQTDARYPDMALVYHITGIAGLNLTWAAEPILKVPLKVPYPGGVPIGTVILSYSTVAPDGYVPLDGTEYPRTGEMTDLWAFAVANNKTVPEAMWNAEPSKFSAGDGVSTFRVPRVGVYEAAILAYDGLFAGTRTDGEVQKHTHTGTVSAHTHTTDNATGLTITNPFVKASTAANLSLSINSTGSDEYNKAAGIRFAAYIKYRKESTSSGGGSGGTGGPVAFIDITGNPGDNTALALVLAGKQSVLTAAQMLGVNQSATAFAVGDGSIKVPTGKLITSGGVTLIGADATGTTVTVGSVPAQLVANSKMGGTAASNKLLTEGDVTTLRTGLAALDALTSGFESRIHALEVGRNVFGSHFPMRAVVGSTTPPEDLNGVEVATLFPAATYPFIYGTADWLTAGDPAGQGVTLSQNIDIQNQCVIIAATMQAVTNSSTLYFLMGNSYNNTDGYGLYIGMINSEVRIYMRTTASFSSIKALPGTFAVGTPHRYVFAFDGPNHGLFIWVDGVQQAGISSGAWTGDAHNPTKSRGLTVGTVRSYLEAYTGTNITARFRDVCVAPIDRLPTNLNAIAAAYNEAPQNGLIGAIF